MNKQSEKPRGLLSGKTVLLCVTGGIAAYKMPNVARMLKKLGCNVHVLMTQNATNFITATTFETLTANKCLIDTFDRNFEFSVEHVALAKQADLVLIAPATANVIGKIANGIADDMLTTTVMACTCKCLIAPAMNHNMYHNPIVQDNIRNPFANILMNDAALVNMHYNKKEVIKKQAKKWFSPAYGAMLFRNVLMLPYREFSSFKYSHLPSPFLKATYWKVWDEEGAVLDEVCKNRFRTVFDVNQYVMKYWQYMEGKFTPQSPKLGRFYTIGKHDQQIHHTIRRQACKMICLNDDVNVGDFEKQKKEIQRSFEVIFPEKSSFEM